jgi:hypothetical protein
MLSLPNSRIGFRGGSIVCGLVLQDAFTGQSTTSHVQIVERLIPEESYDLALVCVRLDQVPQQYLIWRPTSTFPRWCFY